MQAAGKQLKEPIKVPRPGETKPQRPQQQQRDTDRTPTGTAGGGNVVEMDPYKRGVATLMRTRRGGGRR